MLTTNQQKAIRDIAKAAGVHKVMLCQKATQKAIGYYRHRAHPSDYNMLRLIKVNYYTRRMYHDEIVNVIERPLAVFIHEFTHRLQHINGDVNMNNTVSDYAYNELIAQTTAAVILNDNEVWRDTACYVNLYRSKISTAQAVNLKRDINKYVGLVKSYIEKYGLSLDIGRY